MWKKRRVREEHLSIKSQLSRSLELPVNVMEGLPQMELLGNREAIVEHCQGVLEYSDRLVRLNAGRMTIKFTGRGLQLKNMSDSSVVVEGYFTSIEFIQ